MRNIFTRFLRYDQTTDKYITDDTAMRAYGYTDKDIQAIHELSDSMNVSIQGGSDGSTLAQSYMAAAISTLEEPLTSQGETLADQDVSPRRARGDFWRVVQGCIADAWKGAIDLVALKGVMDLLKGGNFAAAAAKLAKSAGGRIAGYAGAVLFLMGCGAIPAH